MAGKLSKADWNKRAQGLADAFGKATADAPVIALAATMPDGTTVQLGHLSPRTFDSGAVGIGGQVTATIGGVPIRGYVSLTVPGSKPQA